MERMGPITFQGDAVEWWKGKTFLMGDIELTWDEFCEIFMEKYFSETAQDRLRGDFERLEQEGSSVSNYAQRFISLARFAPDLVATESRKVNRFISGLRFSLQRFVMSRVGMTLEEAIEIAKQ